MTRMSKQGERRNQSPRKRHYPQNIKTGSKKDQLEDGFKKHENAVEIAQTFISKIKAV
ncbi:MAG TPA: hypothetical protein P5048_00880 [Chlamydiales bacterium]|nr:hypothetical protein [Chlamydiales bacterium]